MLKTAHDYIAEARQEMLGEAAQGITFKKVDNNEIMIIKKGQKDAAGVILYDGSGYSVRIGGRSMNHEESYESNLKAAKDSAKYHILELGM